MTRAPLLSASGFIIASRGATLAEWLDENPYYCLAQIEAFLAAGGFAVSGYYAEFETSSAGAAACVNGLFCRRR